MKEDNMLQIILQYVLIILLVVGLGYLIYLFKDKGVSLKEDYFGIAYSILGMLDAAEETPLNIKRILRTIRDIVSFIEANYKNEDNNVKEKKALELARNAVKALSLKSEISDDSITYLIRLACAFLPPTGKDTNVIQ
jgi:hypothetical protein